MPTAIRVAVMVAAAAIFFSTFHSVSAQGEAPAPAPSSEAVAPPAPSPLAGCTDSLPNLLDCLTTNGSNTTTPGTGCCPELAGLVESNPICLCLLLGAKSAEAHGIAIDVKGVHKLPSVCGVQTPPASTCSALGILVPGPVGSPTASEGPISLDGDLTQPSNMPSEEPSKGKMSLTLIVMIPLIVVFVLANAIVCIYLQRRKMAKRQDSENKRNQVLCTSDTERHLKDLIDSGKKGIDVPFFDLESILAATDSFSDANKLGQGGYGPVYKGTLPGGEEIAVKRLSSVSASGQGFEEFKNEVVLIAKLQHRNLVRLRGYCIKGDEKILLYEYMPNKSLDSFIFDQKLSMCLDWDMRLNIILGIARGLLYLHHDSRLRIIHRDLKTSNILLDEEMNPKISDFGLARFLRGKETEANTTKVVGTQGYMSPEYVLHGLFSVKSDVFSFGVVLLEIISGKKNTGFYQSELAMSLIAYAWRLWVENQVLDLMDSTLHEVCNADQFVKCVNVGLLCVQEHPNDRPTMSNVVTMLDSEAATVPTPKQPAFVPWRGLPIRASSSCKPELTSSLEGR